MGLSTHVLDTAAGRPAAGVPVLVQRLAAVGWREVGRSVTDADGRAADLVPAAEYVTGRYRLLFDTSTVHGPDAWLPSVTVEFMVSDAAARLHVPLLLSPFGYTTYRGS
ncbi:MAG: 5-hydroxyisourate hydrolase [Frankiales bacterium]|jgi:5-hydroxyisourate hydrolase|nr:5-hydroxyisourate hydrolase [Frankiales bacterium]MDX6209629.1 5-hydroxyisourate hydrolase [Frankiales bacterium]MDX6213416.1 5-hydroxyisourate hydrolase [Frankiales bacterium]MDX6221413.1 5-hydroxyisourate hydrolase [Frankiales bacterium]